MQGPEAYITALARETTLFNEHIYASSYYPGYVIEVDYNLMLGAIRMRPTGSDSGEESVEVKPLQWENSPASDGSTKEFEERMAEYRKAMHHFAMHTPYHFLAYTSKADAIEASRDATTQKKKATANKPKKMVSKTRTSRGKKRKASDVSEEEKGLCSNCLCVRVLNLFQLSGDDTDNEGTITGREVGRRRLWSGKIYNKSLV